MRATELTVFAVNQVCGSDHVTYENECLLRSSNCANRRNVSVLHEGPCSQYFTQASTATFEAVASKLSGGGGSPVPSFPFLLFLVPSLPSRFFRFRSL